MEYEQFTLVNRGSIELKRGDNFPTEIGGSRDAKFSLDTRTGYSLHVHPGMKETFIGEDGTISLTILTSDDATGEMIAVTQNLVRGEEFTVEPDTPHFVFNNSGESVTAIIHQIITIPGKNTINFDIASGNMAEQLISQSIQK